MKQIQVNCSGSRRMPIDALIAFQGNLKEMSKDNAARLRKQIVERGWIAPVFVWNGNEILDGHGRLLVLKQLIADGYTIDELPVVDVEAPNRKEAAKILLAINSKFQDVTMDGLYEFINDMELEIKELDAFNLPDIDMSTFSKGYGHDDDIISTDSSPSNPCETCKHRDTSA